MLVRRVFVCWRGLKPDRADDAGVARVPWTLAAHRPLQLWEAAPDLWAGLRIGHGRFDVWQCHQDPWPRDVVRGLRGPAAGLADGNRLVSRDD